MSFLSRRLGTKSRGQADTEKIPRIEIELAALRKQLEELKKQVGTAEAAFEAEEWAPYEPETTGIGNATTDCFYKFVAPDLLLLRMTIQFGTPDSSDVTFTLPAGFESLNTSPECVGVFGMNVDVTDVIYAVVDVQSNIVYPTYQFLNLGGVFDKYPGTTFPVGSGLIMTGTFFVPAKKV